MINEKNEKDLQEYLRGDSELSRGYKTAKQQEPPAYLDTRILKAAGSAIVKPKKRSWYVPISVAAVMVIGVSLLFRIHEEQWLQSFSEPEMNGMTNNEMARDISKRRSRNGPGSLPAVPAADTYHIPGDSGKVPILREMPEDSAASKRILKQEQDSMDIQHPLRETMSIPSERNNLMQDSTGSTTKLQDKAVAEEGVDKEKPAADTGLPAESGVPASAEYQHEEQPAGSPADAKILAPSALISTPLPAEKWLEEISNQWNAGNKEEAIANLRQFLKSYPEYSKPELLKYLPNDFDLSDVAQ